MRGDGRILERLDRIETQLARIEMALQVTAADLDGAHHLADHAGPEHGQAADAAARTPPWETDRPAR